MRPYGFKVEKLNFKCSQAKFQQKMLALNIVFCQQRRDATVKILSTQSNVKIARAHANIRLLSTKAKRKSLASTLNKENVEITTRAMNKNGKEQKIVDKEKKKNNLNNKISIEKKPFQSVFDKEKTIRKESKELPNEKNAKIGAKPINLSKNATTTTTTLGHRPAVVKNTHISSAQSTKREQEKVDEKSKEQIINYTVIPFVLPSESLLEEYVQRKRNELERRTLYALNATALNSNVAIDTLSQSSASASRCDSPPSTASSTIQNSIQNKINKKDNRKDNKNFLNTNIKQTQKKFEGLKSPRITNFDLIENEKMIDLLSYNNKPALLTNAVKKIEGSIAPSASNQSKLQKSQPEKQQTPFAHLAKNLRKPVEIVKKANVFDTPKSLFEEQMQSQASQLRKTSENRLSTTNSNNFPVVYEEEKFSNNTDISHNRSFIDKQSVAQNFAAALASQQSRYPLERYAAHISLSGRQSTTSIESNNSGALDSASRSIDQMIDHARYRHHQQKNPPQNGKFKEAIDYLDQIFEDLRKECDISMTNNKIIDKKCANLNNKSEKQQNVAETKCNGTTTKCNTTSSSRTLPKNASCQSQQQHQQKQQHQSHENNGTTWKKNVSKLAEKPIYSLSKEQQQQQVRQAQENAQKQHSTKKMQSQSDVNVTETVVLPKITPRKRKDNRLDFTRKWLVNDSKMWEGEKSSPNLRKDDINGELSDESEHSLGSCSAEVAAINATEKRKSTTNASTNKKFASSQNGQKITNGAPKTSANRKQVMPAESKKKTGVVVIEPIRPQPYRPQPSQGSSDYDLQKMPSSDKLSGAQFRSSSQNRASSQDHYSMGSTHSQEGIKPTTSFLSINSLQRVGSSTGAFVNYPQRGSIQSLPDAALMPQNNKNQSTMEQTRAVDTSHAQKRLLRGRNTGANTQTNSTFATELELDSLVAELELNTYQEETNDKRRSFPTVQAEKHVTHSMTTSSATTTTVMATSRTNSIGRRGAVYSPKTPQYSTTTVGTIVGNAASIGTVIGQAAINVQNYKQQKQRQRLSGPNSSISPTRRIPNGLSNTDSTESRRSQFRLRQIIGDRNTFGDTNAAASKERGTIGGLAPISHQSQQQLQRKISGGSSGSGSVEKASTSSSAAAANPFETINQERLKPSRVEAIQHMFEKSGSNNKESTWARKVSPQSSNKDESLYCEISEYKKDKPKNDANHRSTQRNVDKPKLRSVNIHPVFCQDERSTNAAGNEPQKVRFRKSAHLQLNGGNHGAEAPTFTNIQPKRPLPPQESSRGSMKVPTIVTMPAANGGGKSAMTDISPLTSNANRHSRSDSFFGGRLSTASSSRAPSLNSANVDDDDDGFYDNIVSDHQLLSSALSDVGDNASLSSQKLPPLSSSSSIHSPHKNGGRQFINKLIRRIGGMAGENQASVNTLDSGRPPTNAASLVSLNKMGIEQMPHRGNNGGKLMKSNSLSYEPWKSAARLSTESVNIIGGAQSDREDPEKSGFGNRLKQTIFGSKRRVAAHS